MAISVSPAVQVTERDLSTTIPALATSVTGMVGQFHWGPCNQRKLITTVRELETYFGKPTDANFIDWFTAYNVLQYNNALYVVRAANDSFVNASLAVTDIATYAPTVTPVRYNDNDDEPTMNFVAGDAMRFMARYPGADGNKITVGCCDAADVGSAIYDLASGVNYSDLVDRELDSDYSEFVVVVGEFDIDAEVSIPKEVFIVSADSTVKSSTGENMYFVEYINRNSKLVSAYAASPNVFTPYTFEACRLESGADAPLVMGDITAGYDLFANPEEFDINLLIDCHNAVLETSGEVNEVAAVQEHINNICAARMDCFAINTVPKDTVVGNSDAATAMVDYVKGELPSNSYGAIYGNWKYQYDSYADKYRWLPISGDVAGIFARNDATREVWFAPAGFNRGGLKNVVKFAFNPDKPKRDLLYKNRINPVLSFPGDGPVVFGQKTLQMKPSAFDRVDVRRLFIYMEKAISTAARYFMFEKNTAFTRRLITGMITPFLADIKGREGLYDFLVVCDESNNTGEVIDRNELVCDIYLKPTKTAEVLSLNFIATKTGVSFAELINR